MSLSILDSGSLGPSRPTIGVAVLALAAAISACDSPTEPQAADSVTVLESSSERNRSNTLHARFFTDLAGLAPDAACGDPPRFLNTQVGEGHARPGGAFTARITFCVDATDLLDDGQLTQGESVPYDSGRGTFTFESGDKLEITIEGVVLPSRNPRFLFQFNDPFEIVGGTGQFEGVAGHGRVRSRVNDEDRTFHRWRGVLELPQPK